MYAIDAHRVGDRATLISAMRGIQFATLFTAECGLACTQIPMVVDEHIDGSVRLRGHLARANPHWQAIGSGIPALVLFQGPDAYVSPSWYPSKAETGKVVPTWAYVCVEARGRLTIIDDADEMRAMLDALTLQNEASRSNPWAVEDAPQTYIDRMTRAIVGITLSVETLDGVWKLNQAKSEADRDGTARGLANEPGEDAHTLARLTADPPPRG